ncbi:hypothetical protein [Streptomyces aureocirculatus]|uniref:hypothetical protein n=1 Tax=Streptomyces aureocirculatus TaxID=67275 RepID=UPI0004C8CCBB|nr:hypothetical protein [Streptomyces aureocirculatus]
MSTHSSDARAAAVEQLGALPLPVGPTFEGHQPAAQALVGLTEMFGHLPMSDVILRAAPREIVLRPPSPDAFEQWRAALQITPDSVSLRAFGGCAWLQADGVFQGVAVHMSVHDLPLTEEQAETPPAPPVPGAGLSQGPAGAEEGAAL